MSVVPSASIPLGYAEGEASIIIKGMQATAYSLRLAVLGSGFPPRLKPSVDMTSDVKSREQLFYVCLMFFLLGLSEEPEPVRDDG